METTTETTTGGIVDVLSGQKPLQTQFAVTTTWQTVVMVVAGIALAVFVMRYLKK